MSSDVARRWLLPALSALLAALWLGGGVTQDGTSMDEWLQLLALPVLWMSVRVLLVEFPADRLSRCGIALAVALVLLLALQLLPLPASIWNLPAARGALTQDLQQAGVDTLRRHWSLAPAATEQGLWALLPALACFFAAITLDKSQRRRVLQVVIALASMSCSHFSRPGCRWTASCGSMILMRGLAGCLPIPTIRQLPASPAWCWRPVWVRRRAFERYVKELTRMPRGGTSCWRVCFCWPFH